MVSRKTAEEELPPPGWKEQVKVTNGKEVKWYENVLTGQKFDSKIGVIRYVNSNNACQTTSPLRSKPEVQICYPESKASPISINTTESPEWLPQGWIIESKRKSGNTGSIYKIYIDPSSGCKFYSKPQVIRYLQTVGLNNATGEQENHISNSLKKVTSQHSEPTESKNGISGEEKSDMGKPSLKNTCYDVEESNGELDELPPGWIKEIRTRKSVRGIRKDPYYIEPENGYTFRSKKDVLRYLKTGDIHSCAIKPQKRDIIELKTLKDAIHSASPPDGNKVGLPETRRQLFVGDKQEDANGSSHASTIALGEAECSKEKEDDSIIVDPKVTTVEEMHSSSKAVECDTSGASPEPKTEDLKQDVEVVHHCVQVSRTSNAGLHEQKLPETQLDTEIGLRKSKKRKPQALPARSSKRLAGNEPEMLPNLDSSEQTLRAAARKLREIEANRSASSSLETDANAVSVPPQLDDKTETEIADHRTVCAEMPLDTDSPNNGIMPSEDQVVQQQTVEQVATSEDYWSDPCFDFAFKTLIGAIPVEDTLALQGCFQQHIDTTHTQGDVSLGQPGVDIPTFFQNDVQSYVDSVQNIVSADQLPTNPTLPPPRNISVPSFNSISSQPPSLEARSKDYQAKVNS